MSEEKEYRKKPVVIKAYQTDVEMEIETLEGTMKADVGDFIVTGVQGEQYPVKPDIFKETYDLVDEEDEKTIEDWYNDWRALIKLVYDKGQELYQLKNNLLQAEQEIIDNTDFKAIYGKNNAEVRKAHLKNELQPTYDAKFELESKIEDAKRKIDFIKSIMRMQGILLECEVV